MKSRLSGYLLVGFVGAAAGGAAVAWATDVVPRLTRGIVGVMIAEMARQGISPDTSAQRFQGLVQAQTGEAGATYATQP